MASASNNCTYGIYCFPFLIYARAIPFHPSARESLETYCLICGRCGPLSVSFADNVSACRFWHMVCKNVGGDLCIQVASQSVIINK